MKAKIAAIGFALLLPTIVAIGAYAGTFITPLLLIAAVCGVTIMVALGRIEGRLLYFYLFGIALGLVYQMTMLGVDVVGSDIHVELYRANQNVLGVWDLMYPDASNTSIVLGLLAPWLSKLLMIDMVWVFKAIFPIALAGVPLVLFATFKRMFGEKRAYFATLFFMIVPVYSMEIAQIAKSMFAELFFALMVYVMVSDWRWPYKLAGIGGAIIMQSLCHYTIAILGVSFLFGLFVIRLATNWLKWGLMANKKVNLVVLLIVLIISGGVFWGYHGYAAQGSAVRTMWAVTGLYLSLDSPAPVVPGVEVPSPPSSTEKPVKPPSNIAETEEPPKRPIITPFSIRKQPTILRAAIGLDFAEVSLGGKIFRSVQFLTQFLIILGCGWLIYAYRRYRVTAEFVGLMAAGGILILACIFLPALASTINVTRFYHISLFFLAPAFVLGVEALAMRFRIDA